MTPDRSTGTGEPSVVAGVTRRVRAQARRLLLYRLFGVHPVSTARFHHLVDQSRIRYTPLARMRLYAIFILATASGR